MASEGDRSDERLRWVGCEVGGGVVGEDGANPAESVFGPALPSRYPLDSFGHFLGLFHRVS